jgi:outer membrane protein TolC
MYIKRIIAIIGLAAALCAAAQTDTLRLSLSEAISMARARSVDAAAALDELRSAYWQYRTYRAELLPEISFNATLPSYAKRYSSYQDASGAYNFVPNDNLQLSGELLISQRIWLTGGTLSLRSSLDYMRQLSGNKYNNFMSIPVALTLEQPLFAANDIKWDRRIEPVRYTEARARFISETEEVALSAIRYFFSLLIAKEQLACSRQNLANAEKLYDVAKAKRGMGQISENDLLQIELTMLNARSAVSSDESSLKSASFQLASFLDIEGDTAIDPAEPGRLPGVDVDYAAALELATERNPFMHNVQRRQLEADYEVAKAKGRQREIKLFAQIGYTGSDRTAGRSYSNLRDNQVVEVGVSIPLVDWGKRQAAVKVAESRRELTRNTLRKETMDFNQNLFILVERFNNQAEQLRLADRANLIAEQRYRTNVETFMVGRISTLDLSDSQTNKDNARQKLLNELYYYWSYFYQLRSITLWDFSTRRPVDADIEAIIRQ